MLSRMALVCASIVITLAIGELAVSVFYPGQKLMRFGQLSKAFEGRQEAEFIDVIFENDPELFWRLTPNTVLPADSWPLFGLVSNSVGLREDHEIPTARSNPEEIRILFLGDSTTFGYLLPHTDTFVQVAENELRARFPDAEIECINAGVPGYTLFQGWRFLETAGLEYEPDAVVVGFGWNDTAQWDGLGDVEHHELLSRQQPPAPLKSIRLAQLLWSALHPNRVNTAQARARLLPEEFQSLLEKMFQLTSERGAELVVLVGAARFNVDGESPRSYRTRLQLEEYSFSARHPFGPTYAPGHIDTVPVAQELSNVYSAHELFFDHVHPTALLNRQIGQAIARALEPWLEAKLLRRRVQGESPPTH